MIVLLALLLAAPRWAGTPDSADASGHLFTCEGQGATEDDAVAAAQGICNDKICKVCGVEVESITETRETLTGVDLSRKVVERCRRVRRAETRLRAKSTDCDPGGGCTAWIQIFYSADDQKQECTTYTKEDFTDPAACEADVQAFRTTQGRDAASFRVRTAALDKALQHCAKIDVRPTPAILALDEKLKAGMDVFEYSGYQKEAFGEGEYRPFWGWWLGRDEQLRSQINESKLLIDRIRLVREYVANKALVFDVIESLDAKDRDTPAGVARIRAAFLKAPVGRQYGTKYDIHFTVANSVWRWTTDTTPLDEALRQLYPKPDAPDVDGWAAAKLFAQKNRVTQADWEWVYKTGSHLCVRTLMERPVHEGGARVDRALQAIATFSREHRKPAEFFYALVGYGTPDLVLDLEPKLEPLLREKAYTWHYLRELVQRAYPERTPQELRDRLSLRAARALAADKETPCSSLASEIAMLAPAAQPLLDQRACACLTGELRNEVSLVNRDDLLKHAEKRGLACTRGLPR